MVSSWVLLGLLGIGLGAGVLSGMFGIGGGIVIVPLLVAVARLESKQAIATSLAALLLPVGILGVIRYYQEGTITKTNLWYALLIDVGLLLGAYVGAGITSNLDKVTVNRLFAAFIMLVAIKMLFNK